MSIAAILVLALGTYLFRIAGPLLRTRLSKAHGGDAELPPRLTESLSTAATVLLVALIASATFTDGDGFTGIAVPVGVLTGELLAWRRAPFVVVVVVAAIVAAALRVVGLP